MAKMLSFIGASGANAETERPEFCPFVLSTGLEAAQKMDTCPCSASCSSVLLFYWAQQVRAPLMLKKATQSCAYCNKTVIKQALRNVELHNSA